MIYAKPSKLTTFSQARVYISPNLDVKQPPAGKVKKPKAVRKAKELILLQAIVCHDSTAEPSLCQTAIFVVHIRIDGEVWRFLLCFDIEGGGRWCPIVFYHFNVEAICPEQLPTAAFCSDEINCLISIYTH